MTTKAIYHRNFESLILVFLCDTILNQDKIVKIHIFTWRQDRGLENAHQLFTLVVYLSRYLVQTRLIRFSFQRFTSKSYLKEVLLFAGGHLLQPFEPQNDTEYNCTPKYASNNYNNWQPVITLIMFVFLVHHMNLTFSPK
jgi:hypothetical protein